MKRLAIALLAVFCACGLASAQGARAVVNLSSCCIRHAPDYESALDTQARMGDVVELLERDGVWCKVSTPDPYTGWTTELSLSFMTEAEIEAYKASPKWICTAEFTHILADPWEDAERISDMLMGDVVRKTDSGIPGWICVKLPDGNNGWVEEDALTDLGQWNASRECTAQNVIALAKLFVGVPYLWGGISPKHFDCSGLVKFCFMMNGRWLPRDCSQQIREGSAVPMEIDAMLPGDLLFFGNPETGRPAHVGIYIGDGHMIHSSQLVRINSLRPEDPDCYSSKQLIAVRRIL